MIRKIFLCVTLLCGCFSVVAQTLTESDHIRRGNRLYADSLYEKAEVEYRKALELNPQSVDAMYNLGNALFYQIPKSQENAQEKGEEAMKQYATAAKLESDKERLAQIHHNLGTLLYMAQQYPQSVEAYKEALRNNPNDDETRYNLVKAMYMLKKQEQEQEQQQNQEENKQEQQQEQQQKQQQEQQQQEQEQQNQQQQQQQQNEEQISKENAEQILDALMQDEKDIQEKQKKMMQQQQGKTLDKDW
jgi:tetratricopeptide (TPR) repeat protein